MVLSDFEGRSKFCIQKNYFNNEYFQINSAKMKVC